MFPTMSVARVAYGALLGAFALGCGERSGDPIVLLSRDQNEAGGTSGGSAGGANMAGDNLAPGDGAGGDSAGGDGAGGDSAGARGPTGLCGDCTSSDECGDANDACLRHQETRFCGRDCDDQRGCPEGYACVELDNSQLWQCVPQNGCSTPTVPVPALADIRQDLLTRINAERVAHDRPPLVASTCLDDLAQASALAFARTDEPLGKFVKECHPIWPSCECGWNAEAELTVARYGLDWMTAVESAVVISRDGQNERFTDAFLGFDGTDVGIGFWLSGDEAWIALSLR
jgi:hypothetical protein